jgi:hypothetical protein
MSLFRMPLDKSWSRRCHNALSTPAECGCQCRLAGVAWHRSCSERPVIGGHAGRTVFLQYGDQPLRHRDLPLLPGFRSESPVRPRGNAAVRVAEVNVAPGRETPLPVPEAGHQVELEPYSSEGVQALNSFATRRLSRSADRSGQSSASRSCWGCSSGHAALAAGK